MQLASELQKKPDDYLKVLLWGPPKNAGKTTNAMGFPLPIVVLSFDPGNLSIPPGIDRSQIVVQRYHDPTRALNPLGGTVPARDVAQDFTRDYIAIAGLIRDQKPLKDDSGKELWVPRTLVLDGMTRLNSMMIDSQCVRQGVAEPAGLPKGESFKFWGGRLSLSKTFWELFLSLPCNVAMTAWEAGLKDSDGNYTGQKHPDLGGKLDIWGAGYVDASLYCYVQGGKFKVRTKGDGLIQGCGVRDKYTLDDVIDVTLDKGKGKLLYEKIWGKEVV